MSRIRDLKDGFGDLAKDKPVEVEIDDQVLELDMVAEDLHPVMMIGQTDNPSEDQIEYLTESLRKVLYRSYLPHWDESSDEEPANLSEDEQDENEEAKQYIEKLLLSNYLELFTGIMQDLGWAEEDMVEQARQAQGNFPGQ